MIKVHHRINTVSQLKQVPVKDGVEFDLHAYGERLVVHHDPFSNGVDLHEWISYYKHALLIVNLKEEGIENQVLDILKKKQNRIILFVRYDIS